MLGPEPAGGTISSSIQPLPQGIVGRLSMRSDDLRLGGEDRCPFGRGRVLLSAAAGSRRRQLAAWSEEIMPKQKRKNGKKARVTS